MWKRTHTEIFEDNASKQDGALPMWLDTTKYYLPDKAKGHARCLLYGWLGLETQRGIDYCETCNANLCESYYKYLYVILNIVSERKLLERKFKKEHHDMVTNRDNLKKDRYGW